MITIITHDKIYKLTRFEVQYSETIRKLIDDDNSPEITIELDYKFEDDIMDILIEWCKNHAFNTPRQIPMPLISSKLEDNFDECDIETIKKIGDLTNIDRIHKIFDATNYLQLAYFPHLLAAAMACLFKPLSQQQIANLYNQTKEIEIRPENQWIFEDNENNLEDKLLTCDFDDDFMNS